MPVYTVNNTTSHDAIVGVGTTQDTQLPTSKPLPARGTTTVPANDTADVNCKLSLGPDMNCQLLVWPDEAQQGGAYDSGMIVGGVTNKVYDTEDGPAFSLDYGASSAVLTLSEGSGGNGNGGNGKKKKPWYEKLEDYLRKHWVTFASVGAAILFLVAAFAMWEHYRGRPMSI